MSDSDETYSDEGPRGDGLGLPGCPYDHSPWIERMPHDACRHIMRSLAGVSASTADILIDCQSDPTTMGEAIGLLEMARDDLVEIERMTLNAISHYADNAAAFEADVGEVLNLPVARRYLTEAIETLSGKGIDADKPVELDGAVSDLAMAITIINHAIVSLGWMQATEDAES